MRLRREPSFRSGVSLHCCVCALLAFGGAALAQEGGPGKAGESSAASGSAYGRELILGGRKGTLSDLHKRNPPNVAKGCFPKPVVEIDASSLSTVRRHYTRASRFFEVKLDSDYTLVFEVKGEGDGYVSGGVRWRAPDAPPGLVDKDEFMTVMKVPEKWTVASCTFTSDPDPKCVNMQILLKAYGAVNVSFRNVRVVEGWWADTKWRFKRPYTPGARSW